MIDIKKGIFYAFIANIFWGLAFIIPKMLKNNSSFEVTLGRYFIFGAISFLLLLKNFTQSKEIFISNYFRLFLYAFLGNVLYYLILVKSIKLTGGSVTTILIGILPVSLTIWGNIRTKELNFGKLIFPLILIFIGILSVNFEGFLFKKTTEYFQGIFLVILCLLIWTWYGVSNSLFLKKISLDTKIWTSLVGFISIISLIPFCFFQNSIYLDLNFILGSFILGFLSSFIANECWNRAVEKLPVTLASQLISLETFFGLSFILIYDKRFPSIYELLGFTSIILGVFISLKLFSKNTSN